MTKLLTAFDRTFREYGQQLKAFRFNARLYLVNVVITGAAMGVFRLLFNFFLLSLGFDQVLLGSLVTISSLTALIAALPMGYLADILGRKASLLLSGVLTGLSVVAMVLWLSAAAYYVRVALMNMSNPVYQTFVMERVESSARATVASLVSMAANFGWAFSPTISGWLQVKYGFAPPFLGTIGLYTISVLLYWAFFWRRKPSPELESSIIPVK